MTGQSLFMTVHILGADGKESSSVESVRKSVASLVLWTDDVLHLEVGHMVNQKRKEWQAGRGCHEFIDTLELATP